MSQNDENISEEVEKLLKEIDDEEKRERMRQVIVDQRGAVEELAEAQSLRTEEVIKRADLPIE